MHDQVSPRAQSMCEPSRHWQQRAAEERREGGQTRLHIDTPRLRPDIAHTACPWRAQHDRESSCRCGVRGDEEEGWAPRDATRNEREGAARFVTPK